MEISFTCNHCGQALVAEETSLGRPVACPKCGQHRTVPAFNPSHVGQERYYVLAGATPLGPLTTGQLQAMWLAGRVTADAQYRLDPTHAWRPIYELAPMLEFPEANDVAPVEPLRVTPVAPSPPPTPPPAPATTGKSKSQAVLILAAVGIGLVVLAGMAILAQRQMQTVSSKLENTIQEVRAATKPEPGEQAANARYVQAARELATATALPVGVQRQTTMFRALHLYHTLLQEFPASGVAVEVAKHGGVDVAGTLVPLPKLAVCGGLYLAILEKAGTPRSFVDTLLQHPAEFPRTTLMNAIATHDWKTVRDRLAEPGKSSDEAIGTVMLLSGDLPAAQKLAESSLAFNKDVLAKKTGQVTEFQNKRKAPAGNEPDLARDENFKAALTEAIQNIPDFAEHVDALGESVVQALYPAATKDCAAALKKGLTLE
jgi:DNA-directed RNA polymerase subunit RPC12/RpoP